MREVEAGPDDGLTPGERAMRDAARVAWKDKPKLMEGRRDPALVPAPAPAPGAGAASDGNYDFSGSGSVACGGLVGDWAAVCVGGLYEGLPKDNTHRVVVAPRLLGVEGQTLFALADGGRAVLVTIHQPSAAAFALFDSLLLLNRGRSVYFGAAHHAARHFGELPLGMAPFAPDEPGAKD